MIQMLVMDVGDEKTASTQPIGRVPQSAKLDAYLWKGFRKRPLFQPSAFLFKVAVTLPIVRLRSCGLLGRQALTKLSGRRIALPTS